MSLFLVNHIYLFNKVSIIRQKDRSIKDFEMRILVQVFTKIGLFPLQELRRVCKLIGIDRKSIGSSIL